MAAICLVAVLALSCFVEVSSSISSDQESGEGLASSIEAEFEKKAGGATATIRCPSGLTGTQGHRLMCRGETSDDFTLEIAVLERGGGAFRWDVVESHPIR
ncbi:MAG: hypothetical protein CL910_18765 [Deltaproteobacteria bacterium]|nr:hypothetical protein [Deltaproteobacteria bacterium]